MLHSTMAKQTGQKDKQWWTIHRKLHIEKDNPTENRGGNGGELECSRRGAVLVPQITLVELLLLHIR
jgi:hypothetical protein